MLENNITLQTHITKMSITKSIIINDIDKLQLSFLNENKWHQSWPVSPITSKKIPTLIKIEFRLDNKDYSWVINPNIDYALQN